MSTKVVVDTVSVRSIKKQFHSVDMYTEYRAICQEENGFFSPVSYLYIIILLSIAFTHKTKKYYYICNMRKPCSIYIGFLSKGSVCSCIYTFVIFFC